MTQEARGQVNDFTDLQVWQMAMDLCEKVYRQTWTFPRQEMNGLAQQLQRAATSIPSNIAEGRVRGSRKEFAHFVSIARGSLAEVRTQLMLAERLEFVPKETASELNAEATRLAHRLSALRRSLLGEGRKTAPVSKTEIRKPKTDREFQA